MSDIPTELKYTKSHEWLSIGDDGTVLMGITDHAQGLLGDLVFVEVPEVGTTLEAGDTFAVVESVKAASDVYTPITGEIVESNELLEDAPETINTEPYGDGWICRIKMTDAEELEGLMDADAYSEFLESESE